MKVAMTIFFTLLIGYNGYCSHNIKSNAAFTNMIKWNKLIPTYKNIIFDNGEPIEEIKDDNLKKELSKVIWNPQKPSYKKIISIDEENDLVVFEK